MPHLASFSMWAKNSSYRYPEPPQTAPYLASFPSLLSKHTSVPSPGLVGPLSLAPFGTRTPRPHACACASLAASRAGSSARADFATPVPVPDAAVRARSSACPPPRPSYSRVAGKAGGQGSESPAGPLSGAARQGPRAAGSTPLTHHSCQRPASPKAPRCAPLREPETGSTRRPLSSCSSHQTPRHVTAEPFRPFPLPGLPADPRL